MTFKEYPRKLCLSRFRLFKTNIDLQTSKCTEKNEVEIFISFSYKNGTAETNQIEEVALELFCLDETCVLSSTGN